MLPLETIFAICKYLNCVDREQWAKAWGLTFRNLPRQKLSTPPLPLVFAKGHARGVVRLHHYDDDTFRLVNMEINQFSDGSILVIELIYETNVFVECRTFLYNPNLTTWLVHYGYECITIMRWRMRDVSHEEHDRMLRFIGHA